MATLDTLTYFSTTIEHELTHLWCQLLIAFSRDRPRSVRGEGGGGWGWGSVGAKRGGVDSMDTASAADIHSSLTSNPHGLSQGALEVENISASAVKYAIYLSGI